MIKIIFRVYVVFVLLFLGYAQENMQRDIVELKETVEEIKTEPVKLEDFPFNLDND